MSAETFERSVFGGSAKPTQIRVRVTRLSITFFLEDHAIISSFFLEDRERNSKKGFWKIRGSFPKLFWNILRLFPTFFQQRNPLAVTRLVIAFAQFLLQFFHTRLQLFQFFTKMWHATQVCIQSLVVAERLNRNSPPDTGPHNFSGQHAGFRSDHG